MALSERESALATVISRLERIILSLESENKRLADGWSYQQKICSDLGEKLKSLQDQACDVLNEKEAR